MPVSTVMTRRTPSAYAASSTRGLQAVALAQAMRHVKADHAAEHFDRSLEQHNGGGAVDVVVAVEQDGLLAGDGRFDAFYGGLHAEHEQWIVQLRDFRIEEGEGFAGGVDAACDEEFGEDERNVRRLRESFGFLRMRLGKNPALARSY